MIAAPWRFVVPFLFALGVLLPIARAETVEPDRQEKEIHRLIEQLGDASYAARQQAQAQLARMGVEAFEALGAARQHPDPEIATRARYLLRLIKVDLTRPGDRPEVASLLRQYGAGPLPAQLQCLAQLASLPEHRGLPALCRIIRFETSAQLAKHAAIHVFDQDDGLKPPDTDVVKLIRESFGKSRRPAAQWLLIYAQFHDSPQKALEEWKKLARAEQDLLATQGSETDEHIVQALLRWQARWTANLSNDPKELADAIRAVLQSYNTRDPSLPALTDWLVEQKAWKVLQTDPVTLAEHIASNRTNVLLMLAEAYRDAGQAKLSDAAVLKVLELVHGSASGNSSYHYSMAMKLQSCGFVSAAEREFRKAIELSQATSSTFRRATSSLALMFYEQGDFLKAAQVYEASLKPLETAALASTNPRSSAAMAPALYRERMHTHYALHWASVGDRVKQREALEAALATTSALDSTSFLKALNRAKNLASETLPSADTLIACYQLPDPPPAFREKILKLIKNQVAKTRSEIAVSQRSPIPRNRLAWLVANTEGDLDEALRAAKEATALQPNNSSYHDTLGHCFFAKGDFANAVKSQIRAVEMEPYNLGMRKSLERFRKAYEKETGQPAPKPTPKKQPKLKPIPNRSRASNTYQPTPFGPGGIEIEFFPR